MLMTMYMNVIFFFYVDMMLLYFIIEIVHALPKEKKTSNMMHSQCSKLKSSMPFKWVLGLQKIPQGKQPFKT
jgi:hypothetical protein